MNADLALQQSVDLYRDEFKPPSHFPSIGHGLIVLLVILVFGILDFAFEASSLKADQQQLVKLRQETEKFKTVVASMSPSLAEVDPQLKVQLQRLRNVQEQRQQIRRVLEKSVDRNLALFSEQLLAFARNHEPGITVTRFLLNNGENSVEFAGLSQSSARVPHYLKLLKEDKALNKSRMGVLKVERSSTEPYFEFVLAALQEKSPTRASRGTELERERQRSSLQGWRDLLKNVSSSDEGGQ